MRFTKYTDPELTPSNISLADTLVRPSRTSWFDLSWPVLAILGVVTIAWFGFSANVPVLQGQLLRAFSTFGITKEVHQRALILVCDPDRQLQVTATLSPRGLDPLLVLDYRQGRAQWQQHSSEIRMAVVDGAVSGALPLAKELTKKLGAAKVIVLPPSARRDDIGPLLLNRL